MRRRVLAGLFLTVVLAVVLFLACQGPKETVFLSETFRRMAQRLGYQGGSVRFRSDVHLIEYFIVGAACALFAVSMGWRAWLPGTFACVFGCLEEILKIFLPTREFGTVDLIKDFIGIWVAVFFIYGIRNLTMR